MILAGSVTKYDQGYAAAKYTAFADLDNVEADATKALEGGRKDTRYTGFNCSSAEFLED